MSNAGNLDASFVYDHFRIAGRRNGDAELSATHGNRSSRTIHAIGIRSPAEVIDPNAHPSECDFEQLSQRTGIPVILKHDDGARLHNHEAAVTQLNSDTTSGPRIDHVAGSHHYASC